MIRKQCVNNGHDFRSWNGVMLPVEFCRRFFCRASRPAEWVEEPLKSALQTVCNERDAR